MHRSRGRTADIEMRLRLLREHTNFAELSQAAGNYAPDLEAASQAAAKGYPICLYLDAGASVRQPVVLVPTVLLPARAARRIEAHALDA